MVKKIEKSKFIRTKQHCNIGTIGHVDHGKTTLTAAITKALVGIGQTEFKDYGDIDFHPEEKKRGITINATHVEYETEKRHYSHIDCPGHQDFIKNMITGANQMDGVILVVSVVDGVQVQTKEHVILAKEIGIKYMIVFLNKIDAVVDSSIIDLVELEVRELIEKYGYSENTPFIRGSARKALEGDKEYLNKIKQLMEIVDEYVKDPIRDNQAPFLMPIESVVVAQGRGTVVTGKVEKGQLKIGTELELFTNRQDFKTICMGIEMYRKILDFAQAGDNIGVLVKNVPNKEVIRGDILATPGSVKWYKIFKARIYVLSEKEGGRAKPFRSGYKPQFFFRVSNITGTVTLEEGIELAMPGENMTIKVSFLTKAILNEGLRFIIREGKLTIGAGVIISLIE